MVGERRRVGKGRLGRRSNVRHDGLASERSQTAAEILADRKVAAGMVQSRSVNQLIRDLVHLSACSAPGRAEPRLRRKEREREPERKEEEGKEKGSSCH